MDKNWRKDLVSLRRGKPHKRFGPDLIPRILGRAHCAFPLCTEPLPVRKLDVPQVLYFFLGTECNRALVAAVCDGESVKAGQTLALLGNEPCRTSPVNGRVKTICDAPDIRAGKPGRAITIEPDPNTSSRVFQPIDPNQSDTEAIRRRLREAGVRAENLQPVLFDQDMRDSSVVVLAMDQEPGVCVSVSLFEDRKEDIDRALSLVRRVSGAGQVLLATSTSKALAAARICQTSRAKILEIPPLYPESLTPMVIRRVGDPKTKVLSLETTLAVLDAVEQGRVQERKTITLIRRGRSPSENIRVMLGTRLLDVVRQCELEVADRDKLIAGGPMRGFAQYSLQAAVDEGIEAVVVVRKDDLVPSGDDPCINCGACIDVCPVHLQVQLIGRYSEFGKFDTTRNLGIDLCIECGLCASVCTARRPLLQFIRLAKQQLTNAEENAG